MRHTLSRTGLFLSGWDSWMGGPWRRGFDLGGLCQWTLRNGRMGLPISETPGGNWGRQQSSKPVVEVGAGGVGGGRLDQSGDWRSWGSEKISARALMVRARGYEWGEDSRTFLLFLLYKWFMFTHIHTVENKQQNKTKPRHKRNSTVMKQSLETLFFVYFFPLFLSLCMHTHVL